MTDARVATVGGRPILLSTVEDRLAEWRRGPRGRVMADGDPGGSADMRRWAVHELVTEAVVAHEASAAGIADEGTSGGPDGAARARTTPARPSADAVIRLVEIATASLTVTTREVRAYYIRNADRYRRPEARRVRHILVADRRLARHVILRLSRGEDIAVLAGQLSSMQAAAPAATSGTSGAAS